MQVCLCKNSFRRAAAVVFKKKVEYECERDKLEKELKGRERVPELLKR